jgi:hypothetical protein
MSRRVLDYRTEAAARGAMKSLLRRYPVHPDCRVKVVASPPRAHVLPPRRSSHSP